jgi:hypothetical protein
MNLNFSGNLAAASGPGDKDSNHPLAQDGPASAPASRVWRICQGESVEEESAGLLALAFGRLDAFLNRHLGETLTPDPASLIASLHRRCRPLPGAAGIGNGRNSHVR